jgi:hypothetical protein
MLETRDKKRRFIHWILKHKFHIPETAAILNKILIYFLLNNVKYATGLFKSTNDLNFSN